ncbi:glycosyltransferase family 39 protein [Rhizobium sp. SGZ-381]|uniref:glycosyltransferase family 39 protein n=1 Tax=Rhizobium sp. SGZ-381 TaxID=3342800 RepID=UPI00366B5EF1
MKPDLSSPASSADASPEQASRPAAGAGGFVSWDILLPLLLAGYFLVNLLVRLTVSDSLEYDEAEQVLVTQWLALGYATQPPLYNWLQHLVFSIGGISIATLAIWKNTILFSLYLISWKTAKLLLPRKEHAAIATLGLLTIPQVAFESQRDLTHTVAVIFCAVLFLSGLFFTLKKPSLASYAITGLATGLGLLAKYNFALLPAAAFLAVLSHPQWRRRIFDRRFLLTAVLTVIVVAPHGWWLLQNLSVASQGTLSKLQDTGATATRFPFLEGLTSLVIAIIGFAGLTILAYWIAFGRDFVASLRAGGNDWTRFIERMLLALAFVLILMLLVTGAEHIKDRWLAPLLVVLPLYLTLKLSAAGRLSETGARRFLTIALAVMVIIPTILGVRLHLPQWTGSYEKLNYPQRELVERLVNEVGTRPGLLIANDSHIGGNMRLYLPDVPVYSIYFPAFQPKYEFSAQRPILAVWNRRTADPLTLPDNLRPSIDRFAGAGARMKTGVVDVPYINGRPGDVYHLGYAVLYPAN